MKWWGSPSEHVVICYGCRKRVTQDELASGAHDHADQSLPSAPAKPDLDVSTK